MQAHNPPILATLAAAAFLVSGCASFSGEEGVIAFHSDGCRDPYEAFVCWTPAQPVAPGTRVTLEDWRPIRGVLGELAVDGDAVTVASKGSYSAAFDAVEPGTVEVSWTAGETDGFSMEVAEVEGMRLVDPLLPALHALQGYLYEGPEVLYGEVPVLAGDRLRAAEGQPIALWLEPRDAFDRGLVASSERFVTTTVEGEAEVDGHLLRLGPEGEVTLDAGFDDLAPSRLRVERVPVASVASVELVLLDVQRTGVADLVALAVPRDADGERILQAPIDWGLSDGLVEVDLAREFGLYEADYERSDLVVLRWQGSHDVPVTVEVGARVGGERAWATLEHVFGDEVQTPPSQPGGIEPLGCGCATGGTPLPGGWWGFGLVLLACGAVARRPGPPRSAGLRR